MNKWQRAIVIAVLIFFVAHLIRDVLQELKADFILATALNKLDKSHTPNWYWQVFNTYIIEFLGLTFTSMSLYINKFKPYGLLALILCLSFLFIFAFYWFWL